MEDQQTLPSDLQKLLKSSAEIVTNKYWAKVAREDDEKGNALGSGKRKYGYSPIRSSKRLISDLEIIKLEAQIHDFNLELHLFKESKLVFGNLPVLEVVNGCLNRMNMERKVNAMGTKFFLRKLRLLF